MGRNIILIPILASLPLKNSQFSKIKQWIRLIKSEFFKQLKQMSEIPFTLPFNICQKSFDVKWQRTKFKTDFFVIKATNKCIQPRQLLALVLFPGHFLGSAILSHPSPRSGYQMIFEKKKKILSSFGFPLRKSKLLS